MTREALRSRWSSFSWSERSWSVFRRVPVVVDSVVFGVECVTVKAIALRVNQPTYQ